MKEFKSYEEAMQFLSDAITNACKNKYVGDCNKEDAIKMAERYILSQFDIIYDEKTGNISVDCTGIFQPPPYCVPIFNITI